MVERPTPKFRKMEREMLRFSRKVGLLSLARMPFRFGLMKSFVIDICAPLYEQTEMIFNQTLRYTYMINFSNKHKYQGEGWVQ